MPINQVIVKFFCETSDRRSSFKASQKTTTIDQHPIKVLSSSSSTTSSKQDIITSAKMNRPHSMEPFQHQSHPPPNPLVTYRYTRHQLAMHSPDVYNAFATTTTTMDRHPPQHHGNHSSLEYWTNGKTTHLTLSSSSSSSIPNNHTNYSNGRTTGDHHHYPESHYLAGSSSTLASEETPAFVAETDSPLQPPTQQLQLQHQQSSLGSNQVVRNSLLAGSIAGMVSTLAMYPLDVLRTKMQAGNHAVGPLTVLRQTLQYGGVRALYTGITLPLAAQAVYKGTVFTVHNVTQEWLTDLKTLEHHKLGMATHHAQVPLTIADTAICGFVAGAVNAGLFVTPVELVRNQLIAQDSKLAGGQTVSRLATSSWDVIRWTVREYGVTRLWRGIGISMLRDGVGVAAFFSAKRIVEARLTHHPSMSDHSITNTKPTFATTVLAGALAGLGYWIVSLPLDTMKTWVQSGDIHEPAVSIRRELRSLYHAHDGQLWPMGQRLLRGWQVAYGRGIPSAAITIAVYSAIYNVLSE